MKRQALSRGGKYLRWVTEAKKRGRGGRGGAVLNDKKNGRAGPRHHKELDNGVPALQRIVDE